MVISEILRPMFNTMTPDEKYFPRNRENLLEAIQIQLSNKLKIFPQFFTAFSKSPFNFQNFKTKDESHSLCLPEIIHSEIYLYVNV